MADGKKHIDDLLRDALGDYTEMPPSGAWTDMETRLQGGTNHLDDLFREAFAGHAETPPAGAWADMEERLKEKPTRRRGFIWFWTAAAVATVVVGGSWFLNKQDKHTAEKTEQKATVTENIVTNNQPVAPVTETPQTTPDNKQEQAVNNTQQPENNSVTQQPTPKTNTPENTVQQKASQVVSNSSQDKPNSPTPRVKNDDAVAQKQSVPTQANPEVNDIPARDSDKANVPVDDIASLIRKRGSGVIMNVTKSNTIDSMVKVNEELKQKMLSVAAASPVRAMRPVARIADRPAPLASQPQTKATPVDTMNSVAVGAINQTQKALVPQQDIMTQAKPPIYDVSFIGPIPDETHYLSDIKDMDPVTADATIKERLFLDVSVKMGYERGFYKQTANKFVFAPSFQIGLSDKFSILLQPAFKFGAANYSSITDPKSYYRITESSSDSLNSQFFSANAQGVQTGYIRWSYYYRQTHDSLVVNHKLKEQKLFEAELPVMASYNLGKGWSLYGGPVVSYSNVLKVEQNVQVYEGATRVETLAYSQPIVLPKREMPKTAEMFQYNADNITTLDPSLYANNNINKVRLGYMVGTSWQYQNKFLVDLTLQQNLSRMDYIPNAGVRNIYLQPYVRFMVGYKLNGKRK